MSVTTVEQDDRTAYAGYIDRMLNDFRVHAGVNSFVWNNQKLNAARYVPKGLDTSDAGAFKGAWHIVRPWVTEEFRQWVDEYDIERVTFSQWREIAARERAAAAFKATEYFESAAYCLDELQALRDLQARRDELVISARERGADWRAIGEAIGMSRAQLHNIATRHAATMASARREVAAGVPSEWAPRDDEMPF